MRVRCCFLVLAALAVVSVGMARQGAARGSAKAQKSKQISLEGWPSETFALPPAFAPKMPKGTESLRFAPGWRKAGDEGFWSYAFVMWIEEPLPSIRRIDTLLETYYNGLLTMFAKGEGKDISGTPVRVDVSRKGPGKFEAKMRAIDAFATFKPISIRFEIESVALGPKRSALRIKLSPQPKDHAIWMSLDAAIADILAKNKALEGPPKRIGIPLRLN